MWDALGEDFLGDPGVVRLPLREVDHRFLGPAQVERRAVAVHRLADRLHVGVGIRVEQLPPGTPDGHPDLAAVLRFLAEKEITSLMIEGGAMVNGAALSAGIVDKVFLYYAPRILAGPASVPFAGGTGFASINDAPCVQSTRLHRFGEGFAVEGYLKDPYAG